MAGHLDPRNNGRRYPAVGNPASPAVLAAIANIPSNKEPNALDFQYFEAGNVKQVWDNMIERAGIDRLTPHSCRHGFATGMLQSGYDPKTVAQAGGWKDAATVMKFYAHAMEDKTVTVALFGTNLTQANKSKSANYGKKRNKSP